MNILALADIVPYPPNTGIKIRTFNVLRELHRCGDRVDLICFNHPVFIHEEFVRREARAALLEFCRQVHILDIPGEKGRAGYAWKLLRNLMAKDPYRVTRYWSKECRNVMDATMAAGDIDLLHLDKTEFYCYAERHSQVPAIPTNHNVESLLFRGRADYETSHLRRHFARLQGRKTRAYEERVLGEVSGFVTCTDHDLSVFRDQYGIATPGVVIDNGVDVEFYEPRRVPRGNYVLIIGAQNREATANFDATVYFMENIWPRLRKSLPEVRLVIVGRNPDPQVLAYSQADKRIDVRGFIDDEREVFAGANALLVPLRIGGGSRLKILTALAMGTPVVSTTIGAEGIACTDGIDILLADDPRVFADRVVELCTDNTTATRIAAAGRTLAEQRYDWRVIGRRLHDYYATVVENSRRGAAAQSK
jgi:glycosyltransferase involved in cell wall biosynthesis